MTTHGPARFGRRAPDCTCEYYFTCRSCLDRCVERNRADHDPGAALKSAEPAADK